MMSVLPFWMSDEEPISSFSVQKVERLNVVHEQLSAAAVKVNGRSVIDDRRWEKFTSSDDTNAMTSVSPCDVRMCTSETRQ